MTTKHLAEQVLHLPLDTTIDHVRQALQGVDVDWPSIVDLHQTCRAYLASEALASAVRECVGDLRDPHFITLAQNALAEYDRECGK